MIIKLADVLYIIACVIAAITIAHTFSDYFSRGVLVPQPLSRGSRPVPNWPWLASWLTIPAGALAAKPHVLSAANMREPPRVRATRWRA